jgi:carbohydrate kinase (thermoresistant glucokinase family)
MTGMDRDLPPLVVMGVSGCGKSTIGALLGKRLGIPFADGDDFHPTANKEKMAAGIPLTDIDRTPWLAEIGKELAPPADGTHSPIIACSALKRSYRDLLRRYAPDLLFIHLAGDAELIASRLADRTHEYMPSSLLKSQLATLEELGAEESHLVISIGEEPELLVQRIVRMLPGTLRLQVEP